MPVQARNVKVKICRLLRTDNNTPKLVLPKGAYVLRVTTYCDLAVDGGTPSHTFRLGLGGATGLQVFLSTRSQGNPSLSAAGAIMGNQMTTDQKLYCTFGASSSTVGATGWCIFEYVILKDGETIDG